VDWSIHQLSDPQGSVLATLFDAAVNPRLVVEVEYDPYGWARRTAQGDFTRDGQIGSGETTTFHGSVTPASGRKRPLPGVTPTG
jgi:hypothetical protein